MENARKKLDEETQRRQQRHEAAKQYREQQELLKKQKTQTRMQQRVAAAVSSLSPSKSSQMLSKEEEPLNSVEIDQVAEKEREHRLLEINRLTKQLEEEKDMTTAKKYAVKKMLALHKAAIMKTSRRSKGSGVNGGVNFSVLNDSNENYEEIMSSSNKPAVSTPGAARNGGGQSPEEMEEYVISERGRPISTRIASKMMNSATKSAVLRPTTNAVIGYHIEERASYDSDSFGRAVQQPVGVRSNTHVYPQYHRNNDQGDGFMETREDFYNRNSVNKF